MIMNNEYRAKKYLRKYVGEHGRVKTKADLPKILSEHPESRNHLMAAAMDMRLGYISIPESEQPKQPAIPSPSGKIPEEYEKVLRFFDLAELVGISNHEITNLLRKGASEDEIMDKLNASLHRQAMYDETPF